MSRKTVNFSMALVIPNTRHVINFTVMQTTGCPSVLHLI